MFGVMKILVIDDDRDLVDVLTYVLHREGFTVVPAYDGEAGWRALFVLPAVLIGWPVIDPVTIPPA